MQTVQNFYPVVKIEESPSLYTLIGKLISKILIWRFERRKWKLIAEANRKAKETGYKYMVIKMNNRLLLRKKSHVKKLIRIRYFKKGTTIQQLEQAAIYVTP